MSRRAQGTREHVFSVDERERASNRLLEMASADDRVVAAAIVGSVARNGGDRWSDIDLTFAVADDVAVCDVLADWTFGLEAEFKAVQLFDLPSGAIIFRVFLLPGCLQCDISFTPASEFGDDGPGFRLLYGEAVEKPRQEPDSPRDLFGYAVHHALRARFCIERRRYWQAEYWISSTRDYALSLACRQRALPTVYGRGFDDLPAAVRERFATAFASSLDPDELLRALTVSIEGLLQEASAAGGLGTAATAG
jgi:hypothetical protein